MATPTLVGVARIRNCWCIKMEPTSASPSDNFSYHVLQALTVNPTKTILAVGVDSITCEQFHQRVSALSYEFKQRGVKPKQRVIVIAQSTELYCIAIAIWTIGASFVIVDSSMSLERVNHCISTAAPSVLVRSKGLLFKSMKILLPALRKISTVIEVGDLPVCQLLTPDQVVPSEEVLVTFTTGSTGMPKLLARDHSFVLNQSKALSTFYKDNDELVLDETTSVFATNLPVFPLHFLRVGAMCILIPKFAKCDPAVTIKILKKYNTTVLYGSPAFLYRLASYAEKHHIMLPVKYTAVGGAPVFHREFRTIASVTPGKMSAVIYGSTEAEPIAMLLAKEKLEVESTCSRGLCVGRPLLQARMKVIKLLNGNHVTTPVDISRDLELPTGEIGELIISGWHVNIFHVDSKWLITDKDNSVWLRTEDVGYIDKEGRIWLVGRLKWKIVDSKTGKTHWSTIVEQEVLDRCSLITFATYLPHDGKAWLFVEAPNGLPAGEEAALRLFLKQRGVPVDEMVITPHVMKDHRHNSKPNTGALFSTNKWQNLSVIKFILMSNLAYLIPTFLLIILIAVILF